MTTLQAACALLLITGTAQAEALIDYRVLFESYADQVEASDNGRLIYRTLDLGDGVRNRCKGEDGFDDCVSIVIAEDGATSDCALAHAAFTLLISQRCEIGTVMQRSMLEKVVEDLGQSVSRTAVPQREWTELRSEVLTKVGQTLPASCEKLGRSRRDVVARGLELKLLKRMQDLAALDRLPSGKCLD